MVNYAKFTSPLKEQLLKFKLTINMMKKNLEKAKNRIPLKMILGLILTALLLLGIIIIYSQGLPYIQDKHHIKRTSNLVLYTEKIPTYIYLKLETIDAFTAENPINISIQTGIVNRVNGIQLTFDGASKYFPRKYNYSDPQFFEKQNEYYQEAFKNIIFLKNDTNPITGITHFSGSIENLIYSSGGEFDIGITIINENNGIIGYETGNRQYTINKAIRVSPPEVLLTIRNNNLMTGLAWVAIGLALLMSGLNGLITMMLQYQTQERRANKKINRVKK